MDIDFEDSPAIWVDVLGVVVFESLETDSLAHKKEPKGDVELNSAPKPLGPTQLDRPI